MKTFRLEDMKGGWFVGDFMPTCFKTKEFEVACKHYKKGDVEEKHVHKIATEVTLIVVGLDPGDATDFCALEDTINVVVKIPSVAGDKYEA